MIDQDALVILATFSQGGYVQVRRGKKTPAGSTEWRVSFRRDHHEYVGRGEDLLTALTNALGCFTALLANLSLSDSLGEHTIQAERPVVALALTSARQRRHREESPHG